MRRWVVVNLHRAFEELDGFSDEVCLGYIREARRQHWAQVRAAQVFGFVLGAVLFIVSFVLAAVAAGLTQSLIQDDSSYAPMVVCGLVLVCSALFAGWAMFAVRDAGLRSAIRKRLQGARCGACSYSLLGLAVAEGRVRCPECGNVEDLSARGLSVADILGVDGPAESPAIPRAPLASGRVASGG